MLSRHLSPAALRRVNSLPPLPSVVPLLYSIHIIKQSKWKAGAPSLMPPSLLQAVKCLVFSPVLLPVITYRRAGHCSRCLSPCNPLLVCSPCHFSITLLFLRPMHNCVTFCGLPWLSENSLVCTSIYWSLLSLQPLFFMHSPLSSELSSGKS